MYQISNLYRSYFGEGMILTHIYEQKTDKRAKVKKKPITPASRGFENQTSLINLTLNISKRDSYFFLLEIFDDSKMN